MRQEVSRRQTTSTISGAWRRWWHAPDFGYRLTRLPGLVTAYGSDPVGFERLRQMIAAEDGTVHRFVTGRGSSALG